MTAAPDQASGFVRPRDPALARRQLAIVAALLIAIGRLLDGPPSLVYAVLALCATVVAARRVLDVPWRPLAAIATVIGPALLAGASTLAIRAVPIGLGLVAAIVLLAALLEIDLALEARVASMSEPPGDVERRRVLVAVLAVAVIAFGGVAVAATSAGTVDELAVTIGLDAAIAVLLGLRVSALRLVRTRDIVWSAATFGVVIALAAGSLRAIGLARASAPAILAIVLFLWDAVHGAEPGRRRSLRPIWEAIVLALIAVVVVAWNLRVAG